MLTRFFYPSKKFIFFSFILIVGCILSFPFVASADPVLDNPTAANQGKSIEEINNELKEGRELLWTSEKIRIPLVPSTDQLSSESLPNEISPQAAITGYVDFYVEVYSGRMVIPFYEMAVETPSNASLESYQFGVYYSGNQFNGGDEGMIDAGAIPILRRTYTAQGLGNIYTVSGSYSITMKEGGFMTSLGYGFVIPQSATRYFKFDY